MDTITKDGYYTVRYTSGEFAEWNIVRVRKYNNVEGATEQILTKRNDGRIYIRCQNNNNIWSKWKSTALNSDLTTKLPHDVIFGGSLKSVYFYTLGGYPSIVMTKADGTEYRLTIKGTNVEVT